MHDSDRDWLRIHSHESSIVTYGAFGTATYLEDNQRWHFLRSSHRNGLRDETEEVYNPILRFISEPKVITESPPRTLQSEAQHGLIARHSPTLAPASGIIRDLKRERISTKKTTFTRPQIAFGSAAWLSVDHNYDSGSLTVPVTAYVTGPGSDILEIACMGRRPCWFDVKDGINLECQVPALIDNPRAQWSRAEKIGQISFSNRDSTNRGDTYLAARLQSRTCFFEPLLKPSGDGRKTLLDSNLLLTLDTAVTGGSEHADVQFDPLNHRQYAIVDIEGNWSIWKLTGRRTTTARILYQAGLKTFGKLFSWEQRKRPGGTNPYFDGWHRAMFVSSTGSSIDHVVVCNRRDVRIFDFDGNETCAINIRPNSRRVQPDILEIKPGPKPNICLILTTEKLLIFDVASRDWKGTNEPELICALEHFHNPTTISLSICTIQHQNQFLVGLCSGEALKLYVMHWVDWPGTSLLEASDAHEIALLPSSTRGSISSIVLATCDAAVSNEDELQTPVIVQVIVGFESQAILVALATVNLQGWSYGQPQTSFDLRLPPLKAPQVKSARFVDDVEDEDNISDFIVNDGRSGYDHSNPVMGISGEGELGLPVVKQRWKDLTRIGQRLEILRENISMPLADALRDSELHRHDLEILRKRPGIALVAELLFECAPADDIEVDSVSAEKYFHTFASGSDAEVTFSMNGKAETILQLYMKIFSRMVETMSEGLSGRARVQREKLIRILAADQVFARRGIRHLVPGQHHSVEASRETQDSDGMILSDPIGQQDNMKMVISPMTVISASQPQPQAAHNQRKKPEQPPINTQSPLRGITGRLQAYTNVDQLPSGLLDDDAISNQLTSILAHLPTDAEASPAMYDYQYVELELSIAKAGPAKELDSHARRKAEKLAKARERAEARSRAYEQSRPERMLEQLTLKSAPKSDMPSEVPETLPVNRFPPQIGKQRQVETQPSHHATRSDGIEQPAGSSQTQAMEPRLTMTQPERGAFANRPSAVHQNRVKKKKRKAGF